MPMGTWRQFVHVLYANRHMEVVPKRKLVIKELKAFAGEEADDWLEDVTIGWRYHEPLGSMVCKSGKVFRKFRIDEWQMKYSASECCCGEGRHAMFLNPTSVKLLPERERQHVITTDTNITDNLRFMKMLSNGLNHIHLKALDLEDAMEELEKALGEYSRRRDVTRNFPFWMRSVPWAG
ncbi:hypothetical protein CBR_g40581 [Chara braunii]|uniref:Uncharacterized protein n=1 Tax=Chara braunii TaxID=69332 RepID=A0A388K250_CHABU|nr:hypothetical protein CBR_g40581 [Chara braunii]|eukprot:GBG64134.1 hypothetical protein CBR_g40581 [Chara braunii]